jgi:hypothetical protein
MKAGCRSRREAVIDRMPAGNEAHVGLWPCGAVPETAELPIAIKLLVLLVRMPGND